ncbi:DJ-1/PfpI family protein [Synechococcus sp. MIT S1220]|uniref:DJ-1/PfpI family protein n=1 Tax=Synechococcus sp. MIT S1220 TaxID=3082549 RepID=UPI0039B01BB3
MNIAFIAYEDMTGLDLVGFLDPVVRLRTMGFIPDLRYDICTVRSSEITDDHGLKIVANKVDQPLVGYDLVFVPGTYYIDKIRRDENLLDLLRTAKQIPLKVSVCTGGVLFGEVGFLQGLRATTHPNALRTIEPMCAKVVRERVVDEGDVITAGGVTSAIDAGLHVVKRLAGADVHDKIAVQMDYRTPFLAFKAGEKRFDALME